jgi:hypothetical protein
MYSTIPFHSNIKSSAASPGRSCVGPALYEFSFLGTKQEILVSIDVQDEPTCSLIGPVTPVSTSLAKGGQGIFFNPCAANCSWTQRTFHKECLIIWVAIFSSWSFPHYDSHIWGYWPELTGQRRVICQWNLAAVKRVQTAGRVHPL